MTTAERNPNWAKELRELADRFVFCLEKDMPPALSDLANAARELYHMADNCAALTKVELDRNSLREQLAAAQKASAAKDEALRACQSRQHAEILDENGDHFSDLCSLCVLIDTALQQGGGEGWKSPMDYAKLEAAIAAKDEALRVGIDYLSDLEPGREVAAERKMKEALQQREETTK
jgi:hypothetical protein